VPTPGLERVDRSGASTASATVVDLDPFRAISANMGSLTVRLKRSLQVLQE
jgi:hypothetical protein